MGCILPAACAACHHHWGAARGRKGANHCPQALEGGQAAPPPAYYFELITRAETLLLATWRNFGWLTPTLLMHSQSPSNCFISDENVSSNLTSDKSQAHAD